jgi:hypothetical protein
VTFGFAADSTAIQAGYYLYQRLNQLEFRFVAF